MKKLRIKQSFVAVAVTWLEIFLAAACTALFFFPVFNFLDVEMFPLLNLSQFEMLFGGSFECGQIGNLTVNANGNVGLLVGFLVPLFMILILYYRKIIRPFFAYLLHAFISVALLFYLFTTCSAAGGIVRENSDIVNTYQLTEYWYILVIIVFLGLVLSILLIIFDIYRLRNRQKKFEEDGEEEEEEEKIEEKPKKLKKAEKAEKTEEVKKDNTEKPEEAPLSDDNNEEEEEEEDAHEEELKPPARPYETEEERINRSVREALAGSSSKNKTEDEPVAHISSEVTSEELQRNAKRESAAQEEKEPAEKCTVKVVKAKVKPASTENSAPQRPNRRRSSSYTPNNPPRKRTPAPRVRNTDDDFDMNSGY